MSDPIRTQVIDSCVAIIELVASIEGASRGIGTPHDVATAPFPYSFCFDDADHEKTVANRVCKNKFMLNIETWVKVSTDAQLAPQFDVVEADIHKALLTSNIARTYGLSITEHPPSRFSSPEAEGLGATTLPYEIEYKHKYGDPYSLNP